VKNHQTSGSETVGAAHKNHFSRIDCEKKTSIAKLCISPLPNYCYCLVAMTFCIRLQFLVLMLAILSAASFQTTGRHCHHQQNNCHAGDSIPARLMVASSSNPDDHGSLSGIVDGMLQAHREISREMKELHHASSSNVDGDCHASPLLGSDGVYHILTEEQLHNFKAANAGKLIILKFSSPVCQACRMLKQKFGQLHHSSEFQGQPVVFGDISVSNNKHHHDPFRNYITSQLQVTRIPTIQFFSPNGNLVGSVGCDSDGCSWSRIKHEMEVFITEWGPTVKQLDADEMVDKHDVITNEQLAHASFHVTTTSSLQTIQKRFLSLVTKLRHPLS
jgi:hypothetical protein